MKNTILLVEDDVKLSALTADFLRINDFEVTIIENGLEAIEFVKKQTPMAVILDIMLPGVDGLTVCRSLRETYNGPILMLTALDDDIDEVVGLETGADDYLTKPIKPRVLLAHLRALLRRIEAIEQPSQPKTPKLLGKNLAIDPKSRTVTVANEMVHLTTAEYNLLWLLAEKSGEVLSREELHRKTFRIEYDGLDRSIDLRISRLRKKLGDDPRVPFIIKTIRGEGYLLAQ
ncbi:response regulator [Kangiella sp. TOML190]|uniref:response regulator n=1 Tax=Kangiella sp. TOML190 TaxID=2931351 RepID=UPI002040E5EB|nr:response regulator [Kangiella sp. TOML190]